MGPAEKTALRKADLPLHRLLSAPRSRGTRLRFVWTRACLGRPKIEKQTRHGHSKCRVKPRSRSGEERSKAEAIRAEERHYRSNEKGRPMPYRTGRLFRGFRALKNNIMATPNSSEQDSCRVSSDTLTGKNESHLSADNRRAILEIVRDQSS